MIAAVRFSRGGFILMYHRVLPDNADTFSADSIVVRPRTFERQMAFLKRHFRVLSVQELEEHLTSRTPLPPRSCIVTFDDGWHDNFEFALPILEQHQVPAIVFVATDYIGGSTCFWQERVARLLFHAVEHGGSARELAERWLPSDIAKLASNERRSAIRDRVDRMKNLPAEEIAALEELLVERMATSGAESPPAGDDRFMTWPEVRRLAQGNLVAIGSHGKTHTPLTALGDAEAGHEMAQSRATIGTEIERPVTAIGYPNGNFSDRIIELARAAGYTIGFTTAGGSISADHPLRLPRINIHEAGSNTMSEFLCTILLIFRRLRRPTTAFANANTRH
jgi:peptidoglycan/xylan/chitin deacetylase (PgdA/CDA1 family)